MVEGQYDPEQSMYSPEQFIELSRVRRSAIASQISHLRYEYEELLAEEIRVKVEIITNTQGVHHVGNHQTS